MNQMMMRMESFQRKTESYFRSIKTVGKKLIERNTNHKMAGIFLEFILSLINYQNV